MKLPKAKAALDAELAKLESRPAWDISKVRSNQEIQDEARIKKIAMHLGDLVSLCHSKHAELDEDPQTYKGRVVFRGDSVEDEQGFSVVFTEQGSYACRMVSAKCMDSVAMMPGMDGETSDAESAYAPLVAAPRRADRFARRSETCMVG